MIVAGKIEIPDECPSECSARGMEFYQGNLCSRCPVFCCVPDNNGFSLIDPSDYREEWAKEFVKFFNKEVEWPELKLK